MKKILFYIDTKWALGRVNNSIISYLKDEFICDCYDWAKHKPEYIISILDNYDICVTNLLCIIYFNKPGVPLKKIVFMCHGYPEFDKLKNYTYPPECLYSITSRAIEILFPDYMKPLLHNTFNGVELNDFLYKERTGKLEKIGWCGATHIITKRSSWTIEIATKTNMILSFATKLSYDEMKKWYHSIDILIINSGPEEWSETGPLPAFEAIASGVLVIGTLIGNFKEIPGPKYSTIDEAIAIINELKKNPMKVKELAKQQYEEVKQKWSYEKLVEQWKIVFIKSLENSSKE